MNRSSIRPPYAEDSYDAGWDAGFYSGWIRGLRFERENPIPRRELGIETGMEVQVRHEAMRRLREAARREIAQEQEEVGHACAC